MRAKRWQCVTRGKLGEATTVGSRRGVRQHDDGLCALAAHQTKRTIKLVRMPKADRLKIEGKCFGRQARLSEHEWLHERGLIPEDRQPRGKWERLLHELDVLACQRRPRKHGEPGNVAAWPGQVRNEAGTQRIGPDQKDWDRRGCSPRGMRVL